MKKIFKILIPVITVLGISIGLIYYEKDTVASEVSTFKKTYDEKKYDEAKKIYNNKHNKFFYKRFKFHKDVLSYLEVNLSNLQDQYLNDKIKADELNKTINDLKGYKNIDLNKINNLEKSIKNKEESKKAYLEAEKFLNKKEFKNALKSIDQSISLYESNKNKSFKEKLLNDYKLYTLKKVDKLIKSEDVNDAMTYLRENKIPLSEKELKDKEKEINEAKKRIEEERKRRAAEEKARRKLEAASGVGNVQEFVNSNELISGSNYLLFVDKGKQEVSVLNRSGNTWSVSNTMKCSTGLSGTPTPSGVFRVSSRGNWFFTKNFKAGAKYWVSFYGNYLFHSYPMNPSHQVLDYTLGRPASHGCIRLATENAKWIFDNIPNGTNVYIK
ncbi:L,D-transpeptidase family protein [Hathewaya histolytica]|uniref:ErfK/YbiS/YcfS/YnhG family protein n=1 Tax=Hathewaya histolytica TaxID=1498 RepID=A0A4V6KDG8_HATHI|nr:L,D-transpeptidase family protein [Hathewaya histolytica]VTQ90517.1 ErfK/YbiS/YcfS/YnhG family protein [Hathewaya histolytica]